MEHVYWVIPDLLAGRPGPDRYPWDLRRCIREAFAPSSLSAKGSRAWRDARSGLDHLAIPLPASLPPSPEEESSCRRLREALYFMLAHPERPPTWYCRGQDCTDMVACYLASYEGMSASDDRRIRRIARACRPEHVRYVHRLLGISDQAAV